MRLLSLPYRLPMALKLALVFWLAHWVLEASLCCLLLQSQCLFHPSFLDNLTPWQTQRPAPCWLTPPPRPTHSWEEMAIIPQPAGSVVSYHLHLLVTRSR